MKIKYALNVLIYSILISLIANGFIFIRQTPLCLLFIIPLFLFINIFAGRSSISTDVKKNKICYHGTVLLTVFYISLTASVAYHIYLAVKNVPTDWKTFTWSAVFCFIALFVIFWNGIICVYVTSKQLGIKLRTIGLICGMIPVANLVALFFIIKTTAKECFFETKKEQLNKKRKQDLICATKYPVLLVHGVFFRDSNYFNYWGRIPKELELNGAKIFYGNHSSAASVADSAKEIKARITEVLKESGADKVNIIAHSKGGLDCRYALSELNIESCVASVTTINTPHKGCLFADWLLSKINEDFKSSIAKTYNSTLKKLGDPNPDFLAAVNNLTDESCQEMNSRLSMPQGIYCQSVGTVMPKSQSGKFPLNLSYHLVKYFDGENDGLVSEKSFRWGENYILVRPTGKRGISHGDVIDLNRENIDGFDVREFYVNLVNDLKNRGF